MDEAVSDSSNYQFDRDYVTQQTGWLNSSSSTAQGDMQLFGVDLVFDIDSYKVLQENIFYNATPKQAVTSDGIEMLVWTGDSVTRSNGNQTAIFYSIYESAKDTWSEPQIIEDDGTADFYPDIVTDGTDIYVTWMDSNSSTMSENSSLEEITGACEISVAKYDKDNNSFSTTGLTSNGVMDCMPVLTENNGSITVVWLENSNNDMLNRTGTNTIYMATLQNESWGTSSVYATYTTPVLNVQAGTVNGKTTISCFIDEDTVIEATDLCMITTGESYDITLEKVEVEQDQVSHGGEVPVTLTIKNNSTASLSSVTVEATLNGVEKLNTTVDTEISMGASQEIMVNLPLETTVVSQSVYTFSVTPDRDMENNTKELIVSYTELNLSVEKVNSSAINKALVTVENESCIATSAVLYVRESSSTGKVLGEYRLEIAENTSETFTITSTELPQLADSDSTLYFEVVAEEAEIYTANNNGFIYLSELREELTVEVYVGEEVYTFDTELSDAGMLYMSVYDAEGTMLDVSSQSRVRSDSLLSFTVDDSEVSEAASVKVFLVDENYVPLYIGEIGDI